MLRRLLHPASLVLAALSIPAGAAEAQRIQMPVGYRLTWIGARWQADARVVDTRTGRPMTAQLTYRIADPTVATVSNRGEVTARKPGNTRLWAVAGRDSASALIVVEQWPARFTFSPSVIRFDAREVSQPLRVLASDSAGVPLVGGTSRVSVCRSVNPAVAVLRDGNVVAAGNGSTWIRCSDRGIADSVRVDVQQRPARASISNSAAFARQRAPGDTFSVRVQTFDPNNRPITDARPTWASLNPYVVSVDPFTGRGRAVGGGDTRVIVQVGDVADSVAISVSGPPAQPLVVAAAPVDSTPKSKAAVVAEEMFTYEADTSFIALTVLDSVGNRVGYADVQFRLVDTTIAARLDTARIVSRKQGQTQLVVRYGSLTDTAVINVLPRSAATTTAAGTDIEARAAAFRPPTIPDSLAQHQQARAAADQVIRTDPSLGARRQNLVFFANAIGSFAEYLSQTESGTIEDRTGPLYGGTGSLLLYQKIELSGALRVGTLTAVDSLGEDLTLAEFEGSAGFFPVEQLGLRAGVMLRGKETKIATQTAIIPKVTLINRFRFIGDVFNTYAAFSLLPKAQFSQISEPGSLFSRGGEVGVEFRLAGGQGLNGGLTYYVEQISFDDNPRTESFSAIRLRFGFNLGR